MLTRSASLTSRYITQKPFQQRINQPDYQKHLRKLSNIKKSVSNSIPKKPQHIKILQSIQKYKRASKSVVLQKKQETRKKQNELIFAKLKSIHQRKPKLQPLKKNQKKTIITQLSFQQKKKSEKILQENLILIQNVKNRLKSPKQMKLRIKQNVQDYLSKRALLRRSVLPSQQKKHRRQLSYSSISQRSNRSIDRYSKCSSKSLQNFKSLQLQI